MDPAKRIALEYRLDSIKRSSLDCRSCPPDRNCSANFSRYYRHSMPARVARRAMGDKVVDEMISAGRFMEADSLIYMVGGRCPLLSPDNLCVVHSRKKELGLDGCLQFPVYYTSGFQRIGKDPLLGDIVIADFRCFSIEQNWESVRGRLTYLVSGFQVDVRVKYYIDGLYRILQLEDFINVQASGILPPQRL
jgi:hypothetical protein